jgi:prophage tail gpP-like protein
MATSSVVSKTGEWKDKTAEQIIRDVLKPLKINLKIEGGALPNFKIPRYSSTPGESVHDFIDTLTRHLGKEGSKIGIAHAGDVKGNFCIITDSLGGGDTIVEGKNMLEGREIIYDPNQASQVPSPNQGPGDNEKWGAKVASVPFISKMLPGGGFGSKAPPGIVVPELPFMGKQLQEGRAASEGNWMQEAFVTVYATVHGWLKPSGGLWERGKEVTVTSPMLVMNGTALVLKSVTFSQDNSTGTRSVLELVNTKAMNEGVPTPSQ